MIVTRSVVLTANEKKAVEDFALLQRKSAETSVMPELPSVFSFDETDSDSPKRILPEYQALYLQNSDLAGWIKIEGTPLDAPVMYTPEDGEFYLRRFFDKSDNQYGTPFIDQRCALEPRSSNLLIHGHNMKDSEMFGTLPLYAEKEYFGKHPTISFDTIYETAEYQIASAFLSQYNENDSSENLYYNYVDLRDDAEMQEFSALIKKLSLYETGITLQPGDEVITLITCSYHAANGRMTVVAKKI